MHVIGGEPDPSCPICVRLAEEGAIDFIEVSVCGDATAWPLIPDEPAVVTIPASSRLDGLAELLFLANPGLARAIEPHPLVARVNGEYSPVDRRLEHGDKVTFGLGLPEALGASA